MRMTKWVRSGTSLAAASLLVTGLAAAVPAAARAADCGSSSSARDLNGDGYDDAVVGDPYATVSGQAEAGAVVVLYGDADLKIGEGRRAVLTQASVQGSNVEAGDHFGWSVAMDDATGDGCADLLIGSPGEDWAGQVDAGIVHLIKWTPDGNGGPGRADGAAINQGNVGGTVERGDQFGTTVALRSLNGDDVAMGAVGAPREDIGAAVDAGVVNTFFTGAPAQSRQRQQGAGGLAGTAQSGDLFGASLVIAPLWVRSGANTAVEPSFVVGAPGDTVATPGLATQKGAGSVTVWEPVTGFSQQVSQNTAGVEGASEAGDGFGASLAFSEPTSSTTASRTVAVGVPGEDLGRATDGGMVNLFGNDQSAGLEGWVGVAQSTAGFAGADESGDHFGASVALRPNTGSTSLLAVGIPDEDFGPWANAGMVLTAKVDFAAKVLQPATSYTESSAGTPGTIDSGHRFGLTLAAMDGETESVLAIGSPYGGTGSVFLVDDAAQTRSWVPGAGGVPRLTAGRFGWSIAGLSSS